jgi:WD40 repeat protein
LLLGRPLEQTAMSLAIPLSLFRLFRGRTVRICTVVGDSLAPEEPLTLSGHAAAVYRVAWSPDGHRLATASRDGTSRLYLVDLDDLVDLARSKVTRGLTAEAWRDFSELLRPARRSGASGVRPDGRRLPG